MFFWLQVPTFQTKQPPRTTRQKSSPPPPPPSSSSSSSPDHPNHPDLVHIDVARVHGAAGNVHGFRGRQGLHVTNGLVLEGLVAEAAHVAYGVTGHRFVRSISTGSTGLAMKTWNLKLRMSFSSFPDTGMISVLWFEATAKFFCQQGPCGSQPVMPMCPMCSMARCSCWSTWWSSGSGSGKSRRNTSSRVDPSKPKTPAILAAEKRCSDHPEVAILLEIDPNPSNQNAKKGGSDVPTINTSPIQTHLLHSKWLAEIIILHPVHGEQILGGCLLKVANQQGWTKYIELIGREETLLGTLGRSLGTPHRPPRATGSNKSLFLVVVLFKGIAVVDGLHGWARHSPQACWAWALLLLQDLWKSGSNSIDPSTRFWSTWPPNIPGEVYPSSTHVPISTRNSCKLRPSKIQWICPSWQVSSKGWRSAMQQPVTSPSFTTASSPQ